MSNHQSFSDAADQFKPEKQVVEKEFALECEATGNAEGYEDSSAAQKKEKVEKTWEEDSSAAQKNKQRMEKVSDEEERLAAKEVTKKKISIESKNSDDFQYKQVKKQEATSTTTPGAVTMRAKQQRKLNKANNNTALATVVRASKERQSFPLEKFRRGQPAAQPGAEAADANQTASLIPAEISTPEMAPEMKTDEPSFALEESKQSDESLEEPHVNPVPVDLETSSQQALPRDPSMLEAVLVTEEESKDIQLAEIVPEEKAGCFTHTRGGALCIGLAVLVAAAAVVGAIVITSGGNSSPSPGLTQEHNPASFSLCHYCPFKSKADLQLAIDSWISSGGEDTTFGPTINDWDVSKVDDFSDLFSRRSTFNDNINSWKTSQVTTMEGIFKDATAFNRPLNNWDVSSVAIMGERDRGMFQNSAFNQDLGGWDVSKVQNFWDMFKSSPFNQNISNWNVGSAEIMTGMFMDANAFNQDLCAWNTHLSGDLVQVANMFAHTSCPSTSDPNPTENPVSLLCNICPTSDAH